ncbi:MAG: hypothetical protein U0805_11415 [Pirellulales bacterium]
MAQSTFETKTAELEHYIAQTALERQRKQEQASGRYAVEEIYRKQGERIANDFPWDKHHSRRLADTCRELCLWLGSACDIDVATSDDVTVVRTALSSPALQSTFSTKIGSGVAAGYGEVVDTTAGLTYEMSSPEFLSNDVVTIEETTRLRRHRKGHPATHVQFAGATTPRSVVPYEAQLAFDGMDIVDSATTTGAYLMAAAELGRAARRLYLDLVWSKFLNNPTMYDGTALFHTNHANLITTAMGATGLTGAATKLAGQTFVANDGAKIHLGLTPKYLVCASAILETARETARKYQLDGDKGNLIVVPESRLGAAGVTDPEAETIVTGADTYWGLFAPASQRPAIVVSYLQGSSTAPMVDFYTLDRGQWGMGWTVKLRVGVAFIDWRTMVFSTGVA